MKKLLLLTLCTCYFIVSFGQELKWGYTIQDPNSLHEYGRGFSSNGDAFVITGNNINTVSLDMKNRGNTPVATKHFVAKYNKEGDILWVVEQPGGTNQLVFSVYMDAEGNVYTAGRFSGTLDFDPGPGKAEYTATATDAFVQKLDKDGNFVWVGFTTTKSTVFALSQKSNGNIIALGRGQQTVQAKLANNNTVTIEKGLWTLEFDTKGDVIGAYNIPIPEGYAEEMDVHVDKDDNIIIGSKISGPFDAGLGKTTVLDTSISSYDAFIAKYNSNWEYQWHKIFGDQPLGQPGGWEAVHGITSDAEGNIFACGNFTWTTDFDPKQNPGKFVLEAARYAGSQSPDGFIVKYNPQGEIQWIQDAGSTESIKNNSDVTFMGIVLVGDLVFVGGTLSGGADFDGLDGDFIINDPLGGQVCFAYYQQSNGKFENAFTYSSTAYLSNFHDIGPLGNGVAIFGRYGVKMDVDPTSDSMFLETDTSGFMWKYDQDLYVTRIDLTPGGGNDAVFGTELRSVKIYPNPTNDVVYIEGTTETGAKTITNLSGQVLKQFSKKETQLNVQDLPSGVYFLHFENIKYKPVKLIKN